MKPGQFAVISRYIPDVNLRYSAGIEGKTSSDIITTISGGTTVKIISGPHYVENNLWWQIDYNGQIGWASGYSRANRIYLIKPVGSEDYICSNAINVGETAQLLVQNAKLRKTPGYVNKNDAEDVIDAVPGGSIVKVIGGPAAVDEQSWWLVNWENQDGWLSDHSKSFGQILAGCE